ncbi:flagellar motor switch protein FliM, partial [Vibrio sp. Vb2865]|nr:flagellar motor switch protein FliM [Vibrio sp. Vb2865]
METRVSESISDIKPLDVELLGKPIHIIRDKLENLISESCSSLTNELQNWLSTNKVEASLTSVDLHRFSPAMMDKDQTSTHKHQEGGMVFVHGDT